MNRFINGLAVVACLLFTATIAILAVPVFLINKRMGHVLHRLWGTVCLKLIGVNVTYIDLDNLPHDGASAVLAPNHESQFDIFVLCSLPLDFKWVAKAELGTAPFVGWTMRAMGNFFVRRDRSGHDLNVMREVEDGLKAGHSVVIFPEGTRTRTGQMLPFKKGALRAAQNAGVPVCPVAIQGTFAIAPPGKFPSRRGHEVTVRIGKPFYVPREADVTEATAAYKKELIQLLQSPVSGDAKHMRL